MGSFFQSFNNLAKKIFKKNQPDLSNSGIPEKQEKPPNKTAKENIKRKRNFIIGIDFGTNSTKVIYQIDGLPSKNAFVFCFNEEIDGTPYCAIPSAVSIYEGRVYFGKKAIQLRQNKSLYFSSFKMCLGCFFKITKCKKCDVLGFSRFRYGEIDITDLGIKLTAPIISAFYLAYIMNTIKQTIFKKYGTKFEPQYYFNVSMPLNFLEKAKDEFINIIYIAEKMSSFIMQGIELKFIYEEYKRNSSEVDDLKKKNNCFIVEETRAAMKSVISAGYYETGKYGVIDIGASTTDISIFHFGGADEIEKKFFYYADKCYLIGGDDFDLEILNNLKIGTQVTAQNIYAIRLAKEQLLVKNKFVLNEHEINYDIEKILEICKPLFDRIHNNFSETIRLYAFEKEPVLSRWKQINIIFIGGGSQWPYLREKFKEPPFYGDFNDWNPNFAEINFPDNINLEESDVNPYKIKQYFLYYYVAHGLSYPIFDIYEAVYSESVPPLRRVEIQIERTDRDELYPK